VVFAVAACLAEDSKQRDRAAESCSWVYWAWVWTSGNYTERVGETASAERLGTGRCQSYEQRQVQCL